MPAFVEFLERGIDGNQFSFYVVSAAPREVVVSALDGIVPADHIFGTELDYDPHSGEVRSISRVRAGYGKVAVLDELGQQLGITPDRDDLRRRRQLRHSRDAAREQWRRLHDRRLGEPPARAHRAAAPCSATTRAACWCRCSTRCWGCAPRRSARCSSRPGLVLDDWQRARTDRVHDPRIGAAGGGGLSARHD